MGKDLVIAVLASAVTLPYMNATGLDEEIAVMLGLSMVYLFFCFFLEEQVEKWQERRKRVQKIEKILRRVGGRHERH